MRGHALVVDDVAMDGFIASCILRQAGYEVTTASDGIEAVEAAAATNFDLVLMDLRMPRMGGLEAAGLIRKLTGPSARVPIVALTAMDFEQRREEFLGVGLDAVMSKPFDLEALQAAFAEIDRAAVEHLNKCQALAIRHRNTPAILKDTDKDTDLPFSVSVKDLVYKRPRWAGFGMETYFWCQFDNICSSNNITPHGFIEEARLRRPHAAIAQAVQLRILDHYRLQPMSE